MKVKLVLDGRTGHERKDWPLPAGAKDTRVEGDWLVFFERDGETPKVTYRKLPKNTTTVVIEHD